MNKKYHHIVMLLLSFLVTNVTTANSFEKLAPETRVIVQGDIHGALEGLKENLRHANIINDDDNWVGNNTILIQMGDIIDRGSKPWKTYKFLKKLQDQAQKKQNSKVIRLLGNHEAMLLESCNNVESCDTNDLKNAKQLAQILHHEIEENKVLAAYALGNRLFVHGGLTAKMAEKLQENSNQKLTLEALVEKLNSRLKNAVSQNNYGQDEIFYASSCRKGTDSFAGIFWADYHCDLSKGNNYPSNIKQIVAHSVNDNIVFTQAPALDIIDVDVGLCEYYKGHHAYLLIENNQIKSVQKDHTTNEWEIKILGTLE